MIYSRNTWTRLWMPLVRRSRPPANNPPSQFATRLRILRCFCAAAELILREFSVSRFLENVYSDVEAGKSRRAVKQVLGHLNDLLAAKSFGEADDILMEADVERLDLDAALSFVTITFAARHELANRDSMFRKVFGRISEIAGEEKATRLLARLR